MNLFPFFSSLCETKNNVRIKEWKEQNGVLPRVVIELNNVAGFFSFLVSLLMVSITCCRFSEPATKFA